MIPYSNDRGEGCGYPLKLSQGCGYTGHSHSSIRRKDSRVDVMSSVSIPIGPAVCLALLYVYCVVLFCLYSRSHPTIRLLPFGGSNYEFIHGKPYEMFQFMDLESQPNGVVFSFSYPINPGEMPRSVLEHYSD